MIRKFDYIIIGAGVIGMAIAKALKAKYPNAMILVLDKEMKEAQHASSRNSGVLHAGFYYSPDSLKAKMTATGNKMMKAYCREKNIPMNECGKLVVAQNEKELEQLNELERRGKANGSNVRLIDQSEAEEMEPNVRTYKKALYSPDTASVNPKQVCATLKDDVISAGVLIGFCTRYIKRLDTYKIETTQGEFDAKCFINCAGLYADKVAHDFGVGREYAMLPFKGLYLKYTKNMTDISMNIYPVPDLKKPFLGVHFTKTAFGEIKIGPTAIPTFWREQYEGADNFSFAEFKQIVGLESKLFFGNAFGFRDLAFEEMRKYNKGQFIRLAQKLVKSIDPEGFTEYTEPGIRAQLLDLRNFQLVQDFVVQKAANSVHVLNAVSPAFTSSFPFAKMVVDQYL